MFRSIVWSDSCHSFTSAVPTICCLLFPEPRSQDADACHGSSESIQHYTIQLYCSRENIPLAAIRTRRSIKRHINMIQLRLYPQNNNNNNNKKPRQLIKSTSRLKMLKKPSNSMHAHTHIHNTHTHPHPPIPTPNTQNHLPKSLINLVHKYMEKSLVNAPITLNGIPCKKYCYNSIFRIHIRKLEKKK